MFSFITYVHPTRSSSLLLFLALVFGAANLKIVQAQNTAPAQEPTAKVSALDPSAGLRAQLADVDAKQADLNAQLAQVNEALKPENIESGLAGVGTTRPEELREQRRKQLEAERTKIQAQIDQLGASRTRLESAISQSDSRMYQLKAGVVPASNASSGTESSTANKASTQNTAQAAQPKTARPSRRKTKKVAPVDAPAYTYVPAPKPKTTDTTSGSTP